jgi:tetratricopeptide (TPR) repeat protein
MDGDSLQARAYYERLMALPQAASLTYTARVHLDAMDVALSARGVPPTQERAIKMNDLGRLYWDLGYRRRAEELSDESARLDSGYFWGLLWGFHFNLQNGDTADARRYFRRLGQIDGKNQVVRVFDRLLAIGDSLTFVREPARRSALHLAAARLYERIELFEVALDEAERASGDAPAAPAAAAVLRRGIFAARAHADSIRSGDLRPDAAAPVDSLP